MTPGRKPPHCKMCHKPLKGHKRGVCDSIDSSSPTVVPPSHSVSAKTRKSAFPPLERLPTLSTESSQILNDILRANSHAAPALQVPEFKRTGLRRSGRGAKHEHEESVRDALDAANANVKEQKPGEKIITQSKHHASRAMPGAWEKVSISQTPHTSTLPLSSSCIVSQQLVAKTSCKQSSLDPLTFTHSQQLKLEESTPGESCIQQQQLMASNAPSADLTIRNFLDSMARNPQHPPATIFSYPIDGIASLEDKVKSHGLYIHILSLPNSKQEWSPVVIGRDTDAMTKLLEDGEKLAQGLRQPDKFKVHELDLCMSHVVIGALGALATWAGLAYI